MKTLTNQYLFITTEGDTIAPNTDYPVDNLQVLGFVGADTEKNAMHKLIQENPWIEPSGFDVSQAICLKILTEDIRKDIHSIVDYLRGDEERHYEEQSPKDRKDHIFNILKRLSEI